MGMSGEARFALLDDDALEVDTSPGASGKESEPIVSASSTTAVVVNIKTVRTTAIVLAAPR
jgi:hypothetical protein